VLGLSTLVCLLLFMAYALRPDIAAAVTVFPVWVWVLPGLATQRLCWQRAATRPYKLVLIFGLALWLGLVAVFSEEIWSVPRGLWDRSPVAPRTDRANTLRVVTLNTALNATAAATLAGYEPDIVCLQEITAPEQLDEIVRLSWPGGGAVVAGADTAIITRGTAAPVALPSAHSRYFVEARVQVEGRSTRYSACT
jgi:hypothetical protein